MSGLPVLKDACVLEAVSGAARGGPPGAGRLPGGFIHQTPAPARQFSALTHSPELPRPLSRGLWTRPPLTAS